MTDNEMLELAKYNEYKRKLDIKAYKYAIKYLEYEKSKCFIDTSELDEEIRQFKMILELEERF